MEVIFFLLPIVLLLVLVAVLGFLWALRNGQLDDLDTPAVRSLFDEDSEHRTKLEIDERKQNDSED